MAARFWHYLIALFLMVVLVTPAEAVVLKVATLSPDGSTWMRAMRAGAEEVAQATDQRVRFKFYPGGVMGNDRAVLRKIRAGQLQGGAFPGGTLAGYYGDIQLYSLPLIFKSFEEVDYVRQRVDQDLVKGLEANGFVTFGMADGGFAYVMSTKPVDSIDVLRSVKAWVPANDKMILDAMQGFGINPIALPIADVRTGLQTGLIDTVAISPIGAVILQWHTQVHYLTRMPLVYLFGILALDRKAFARITPADQSEVRRIMTGVWRKMDATNRQDNLKALETLRTQGIEFIEPAPEARNGWYQMAAPVNRQIIEAGHISPAAIDKLERLLNDYRTRLARQKQ